MSLHPASPTIPCFMQWFSIKTMEIDVGTIHDSDLTRLISTALCVSTWFLVMPSHVYPCNYHRNRDTTSLPLYIRRPSP